MGYAGAEVDEGGEHADETAEEDAACIAVCREVGRLGRERWPVGYTWSPIAVPRGPATRGEGNPRGTVAQLCPICREPTSDELAIPWAG